MGRCKVSDCNGVTEYDENAQAVLCTTCGTVTTQDILRHDWDGELSGSSLYFGPTTLKSLRRAGGGLSGQSSKEDRDRRNTTAMHQYILGILTKLACPGLTPRACTLFDQARTRGKFRWGKKALLVAAACVVVVLREGKKGIMMSQLASLMDISPHALCRVFAHMCTLLHLQVPPFDPLSILPRLQSYIMALTTQPNSPLPKVLISMLQPLPPVPVLHLASSLAILLSHLDGFSSPGPSACPTACAVFIMALEGQAASSLPSYTILAQELGVKAGARRDLVIERYRDVSKILEQWMTEVPWLSNADHPDNKLGTRRRKISRRDVIASGIRDVIQFREDIMRTQKSRETTTPVTVALEVGEESDDSGGSLTQSGSKRKRSEDPDFARSSASLRLIRHRPSRRSVDRMDLASLSLLSPSHPFSLDLRSPEMLEDPQADSLQNQILTASTSSADVTLTRLQQLAVSRGGENEIRDDELFEQDELESFLRSENEVIQLRGLFGWDEPDPRVAGAHSPAAQPSSKSLDWELADLAVWEDIGIDKDADSQSGEQILGEWREASPFAEKGGEDSDVFDVCGEW
ncbi:hypothetical protein JB92DRAFT_3115333 [Gautieria morchelliformis]|nr:hypothetical protein JB92DRAFT_3115333 [Gautieria morchelliformis]